MEDLDRAFIPFSYRTDIEPPEDLSDGDAVMEWLVGRGVIDYAFSNRASLFLLKDRAVLIRWFHLVERLIERAEGLDSWNNKQEDG